VNPGDTLYLTISGQTYTLRWDGTAWACTADLYVPPTRTIESVSNTL
jgi:hypothetical protein